MYLLVSLCLIRGSPGSLTIQILTQTHKYTNINTQKQIHKYTNTNTQTQIYNTNIQIQMRKYLDHSHAQPSFFGQLFPEYQRCALYFRSTERWGCGDASDFLVRSIQKRWTTLYVALASEFGQKLFSTPGIKSSRTSSDFGKINSFLCAPTSSCFALIVVLGPRRFPPSILYFEWFFLVF